MSRFTTPLRIEDHGDGTFTLLETLVYESDLCGSTIIVPAGFVTDFASAPAFCWWMRAGSNIDPAATVHDWLYEQGQPTKPECDAIFREALKVKGVYSVRRQVMYLAVRWFGGFAWRGHRKNDTP